MEILFKADNSVVKPTTVPTVFRGSPSSTGKGRGEEGSCGTRGYLK